ncbi:Uroporphyrinogen-III synthase [Cyclonatronum proteinivorum]|uniref:Uroporphyrinogen-III synthase n=1 Tax=Cyclonatronum proteinivorum TaxID=1457365 RepID=A0A345UPE4_9BACT|nr:uroporphyrinogen-III synthase [Cyclonatronum proteinivorum]AXJ02346.1 Uroporphyrinogen-III synthase [Cyclonatronum proteinivorum]
MDASRTVLLTGNLTYIAPFARAVYEAGLNPLELPVMQLTKTAEPADLTYALKTHAIENMVHSREGNAEKFLALMDEENESILKSQVVHFVMDVRSFRLLDGAGLPVLQSPGDRSIDMVEFFLRLNRTGPVLTPCVDPESEEIPEFLAELKYESRYLRMYEIAPFPKQELDDIRRKFYDGSYPAEYVLLHEPGTLTQFLVAFPDAQLDRYTFIPLHRKTEARLQHLGLRTTALLPWHPDKPERLTQALQNLTG